jgi:transcription elongation GreA/GreB family factor
MRIPMRRSQQLKKHDDSGDVHLTTEGLRRLHDEIRRLEGQKPQAIEDVVRTGQFGDFSENAEYQEAKFRLRRIDARIFQLKERLKRVRVIEKPKEDGTVQIGSRVTVEANEKQTAYEIVGPNEANPSRGRVSYLSPLGAALLGHEVGDEVKMRTEDRERIYRILEIQ